MIELDDEAPGADTVINIFNNHQGHAFSIFRNKYLSRGGDNITAQGFPGVLDRVRYDKIPRLKRMSDILTIARISKGRIDASDILEAMKKSDVSKLDAKDDLYDIANYAIIMIMLLEGEWR
jgi:hypothetical protein